MNRDISVHVWLNIEEHQAVKKRMELSGYTNMNAYFRRMALYGYIIQLDIPEIREILRLLRINSNNLNQYAKKANQTGSIYRRDIEDLQKDHDKLIHLMRKVLERLYIMGEEGG